MTKWSKLPCYNEGRTCSSLSATRYVMTDSLSITESLSVGLSVKSVIDIRMASPRDVIHTTSTAVGVRDQLISPGLSIDRDS